MSDNDERPIRQANYGVLQCIWGECPCSCKGSSTWGRLGAKLDPTNPYLLVYTNTTEYIRSTPFEKELGRDGAPRGCSTVGLSISRSSPAAWA